MDSVVLSNTGAHHHKSWDNDDFRTCVLNAIVWTAKLEVPENGVKSSSNPTQKQKESKESSLPAGYRPKESTFHQQDYYAQDKKSFD